MQDFQMTSSAPARKLAQLVVADTSLQKALDAARKRLGALDALPDVYDKVKSEAGICDLTPEREAEKAAEAKAA